ncbi:MAG: hypothetical protein RL616_2142, partial [Verrucomicrobiota bacterium]
MFASRSENLQPHIAKMIVDLFLVRFQPELKDRHNRQKVLQTTIDEQLA